VNLAEAKALKPGDFVCIQSPMSSAFAVAIVQKVHGSGPKTRVTCAFRDSNRVSDICIGRLRAWRGLEEVK
jgi:hypothetical protein